MKSRSPEYKKDWYQRNKERHKAKSRANNQRAKLDAIETYGGKCACCGEAEADFLAIDHINNDGNFHRKTIGHHAGGTRFYYWLRRHNYPTGFQVLCHNCNFSKHLNKGKCLHQIERDRERVVLA